MDINLEQARLHEQLRDPDKRDEGFRRLMQMYGERLYWHIRRIVVGHDDAEDVLQETCIRILSAIDSLHSSDKLIVWIYSIATNESLRHLRRQTRLFQSIDTLGPALTNKLETENPIDGQIVEMTFQKALLTLPTQQRIVFNMRYYDEMSYDEIAAITGKNVGTLKTNYHYATEKIKKYIKKTTYDKG